nr:MAG TPA: hypothetical protein [Caudoviricetes sp.]
MSRSFFYIISYLFILFHIFSSKIKSHLFVA